MKNDFRFWAPLLVRLGWMVMPDSPKALADEKIKPTNKPGEIRSWNKEHGDAGILLGTGTGSGVNAILIDSATDGENTINAILGQVNELPKTPSGPTASGQRVLIFLSDKAQPTGGAPVQLGGGVTFFGNGCRVPLPTAWDPGCDPMQITTAPLPAHLHQQAVELGALDFQSQAVTKTAGDPVEAIRLASWYPELVLFTKFNLRAGVSPKALRWPAYALVSTKTPDTTPDPNAVAKAVGEIIKSNRHLMPPKPPSDGKKAEGENGTDKKGKPTVAKARKVRKGGAESTDLTTAPAAEPVQEQAEGNDFHQPKAAETAPMKAQSETETKLTPTE